MQDQSELIELIDRAKAIAGSDYKVAQALQVPRQHVSGWRTGSRPCPPEDIALLAAMGGMDATAWLARAVIAKHEGTTKGDQLMRALGKASAVITAAAFSSGANAATIFGQGPADTIAGWVAACSTMYRNVKFPTHRNDRPRGGFFMVTQHQCRAKNHPSKGSRDERQPRRRRLAQNRPQ